MSVITIRLSDELLHEVDDKAKTIHVQRAEYIRRALQYMNKRVVERERAKKLKQASLRVRGNSMHINAEFAQIEHDPEA